MNYSNIVNAWRKSFAFLLIFALLSIPLAAQNGSAGPARSSVLSETEAKLSANITVDTIKRFTNALSADEMEGRGTMQPGGDKAAAYIAERFKEMGMKPLGDKGSYFQSIDFRETVLSPDSGFEVGEKALKHGEDFAIAPFTWNKGSFEGDLVFVAYGIQAKSINRDDLQGLNVGGKIVVMLEGPPANIPQKAWDDQKASQVFVRGLVQKGAKAIVFIGHGREKQPPSEGVSYFSRRQISLASESENVFVPVPFVYMTDEGANRLFANSGVTRLEALNLAEQNSFKPIELKQKAKITIKPVSSKGKAKNVAGYFEGSDPALKSEAVVFSAHYDAYGMENGKIYNGAADNALGTSEMLAVAEAFSKMEPKPRRSLIFLAVTGEEYGLYGSKYWSKNPTWDIKKVAANLNLDGIGTEVYGPVKVIVGYGAEHSTLGALMNDVAGAYGVSVMPDPFPEENIFYRSDHYSFVERGVPALMLMGGPEGSSESLVTRIKEWEKLHYHQPSDDVMETWAWEGAQTVAQIMGVMGIRVASADKMPGWLASSRFANLERGNKKELRQEN